jgi:hypothetical protein
MHDQQNLELLRCGGSSSPKSSSGTMTPPRRRLSSDIFLRHKSASTEFGQCSFVSLSSENLRTKPSLDSFNERTTGYKYDETPAVVRYLICLVTTFRFDFIIDRAIECLQRHVNCFPLMMKWEFIRALIKKGRKNSDCTLDDTVNEEYEYDEDDDKEMDTRTGSIQGSGFLRCASRYSLTKEERFSPAKTVLMSQPDEVFDEWGHFADFQDSVEAASVFETSFSSPVRRRQTRPLASLEEEMTQEDD